MRIIRIISCALISFGCLLLSACGGSPSPIAAQTPPTTLTGNWILAGSRNPLSYPLLSATFVVNGTQITGTGNVQIQCSPMFSIGGFLPLSGQIADDGTFQATSQTIGMAPTNDYQVTITGNSPTAASPSTWTGTYTMTSTETAITGGSSCSYNHSATFAATSIAALSGTYAGAASNGKLGSSPFGASAAISLKLTQGTPVLVTQGLSVGYQIPLTATIAVTGSGCFTSGATPATARPSTLEGDMLDLVMVMNDGSSLFVEGSLNDPSGASMTVILSDVGGSAACTQGLSEATLTRM